MNTNTNSLKTASNDSTTEYDSEGRIVYRKTEYNEKWKEYYANGKLKSYHSKTLANDPDVMEELFEYNANGILVHYKQYSVLGGVVERLYNSRGIEKYEKTPDGEKWYNVNCGKRNRPLVIRTKDSNGNERYFKHGIEESEFHYVCDTRDY